KSTVSGDFFGEHRWDFATLAVTPNSANPNLYDLYLTIIKGDFQAQITSQSVKIATAVDLGNILNSPGLFWSTGLKRFLFPLPFKSNPVFGNLIETYDPVSGQIGGVLFPDSATGMTQVVGISSSPGSGDTWLLSDGAFNNGAYAPGSNWMLVR